MKKAVSLLIAASMMLSAMSGCSLLGGKDKQAVEDAATSYVEAVKNGKYKNSKKYVADEEDYFANEEIPEQQQEFIGAVLGASELTVENIEVKKDSASAELVFEMPDLDALSEEGYTFDEFIENMESTDDTVEQNVDFDFTKDGDDWLIEGDSTEDLYNLLVDLFEGADFGGLSEEAAMEAVDTFIGYLAAGNVEDAYAMCSDPDEMYDEFMGDYADTDYDNTINDLMAAYYGNLEYTLGVTEVTDDAITVSVTGSAPDVNTALENSLNNHDAMVGIFADYFEALFQGNEPDGDEMSVRLIAISLDEINNVSAVPYSSNAVVTADENGNLLVDPDEGFFGNIDEDDFDIDDDAMVGMMADALDQLYEEGRITQEDYNSIAPFLTGANPGGTTVEDSTMVITEEGDDYYTSSYQITPDSIEVTVRTMDYYDIGDSFDYIVGVNGETETYSGTYDIAEDFDDHIYISIPTDGDPYGNYQVTVYDEGRSTSVLVSMEIILLADGAPVGDGGYGAPGISMTYGYTSSDFYTFHFVDGNGNYMDGESTYASNRGAIDFFVRTWDYYDAGTTAYCDVYFNGEPVRSITSVSPSDNNDTFEFSYELSEQEDGDYTFVIYDISGSGDPLVVAYTTTETVD